jgi:hypothetical protein
MTQFTTKFEVDIASSNNVRTNVLNFQMFQLSNSGYPLNWLRIPYSLHESGVVPVDMYA